MSNDESLGGVLTCAGDVWPPFGAPGSMAGVTARSTDQATVEIDNRTGRIYYFRMSGWEVAQLESCRGLVELEVVRGPLAPRGVSSADLGYLVDRVGVPITIGIWTERCGEDCRREPSAVLLVPRSTCEPAAS